MSKTVKVECPVVFLCRDQVKRLREFEKRFKDLKERIEIFKLSLNVSYVNKEERRKLLRSQHKIMEERSKLLDDFERFEYYIKMKRALDKRKRVKTEYEPPAVIVKGELNEIMENLRKEFKDMEKLREP